MGDKKYRNIVVYVVSRYDAMGEYLFNNFCICKGYFIDVVWFPFCEKLCRYNLKVTKVIAEIFYDRIS